MNAIPDPNILAFYPCWWQREDYINQLPQGFIRKRLEVSTKQEQQTLSFETFAYRVAWHVSEDSPHMHKKCACYIPVPSRISAPDPYYQLQAFQRLQTWGYLKF